MRSSFVLSIVFPLGLALPATTATAGNVPLTKESWDNYQVDAWLADYMQKNKLSPANLLHDFPQAVHHPLDCGLDQPCKVIPDVTSDSPKETIQTTLVLASLSHFNDLLRMISRLWSNDPFLDNPINPGYPFRTVLVEQFAGLYADFTVNDLSTRVSPELIRVFLNSIWYIPDAVPNAALLTTVDKVVVSVKAPTWNWKDYAQPTSLGASNIEQTVEDIFRAWRQQYESIVADKGGVNIMDFIAHGQMLKIKYARDLVTVGWHTQAFLMFSRQVLSLVLEANKIMVHRGNYDGMQATDSAMGLGYSHDDPYLHETYSPVHFGLDPDGNVTRQYSPSNPNSTFDTHDIPSRVVWGQSWQCFEATNSNNFTSNFARAWSLPAYSKSLFIPDWDRTIDGFDASNPPCTFNLAVNNQPADIKTSWYIQQLSAACSGQISEIMHDYITVDYSLYYAVMLASDAWTYSTVFGSGSNVTENVAQACQAASNTTDAKTKQVWEDYNTNFRFNMALGLLSHLGDLIGHIAPAANAIESSVKGGWSKLFAEKPPVVEGRPEPPPGNLVEPPNKNPVSPDDESDGHSGDDKGIKGVQNDGSKPIDDGGKGQSNVKSEPEKGQPHDNSKPDTGLSEPPDGDEKGDSKLTDQVNKDQQAANGITGL